MKRPWTLAAVLALTLGLATTASATGPVTWRKITLVTGGWTVPMVGVQTTAAAVNPDSCPTGGLYVVAPDSPSHDLFTSMLLTAYARGDQVSLTVSGCYSNWDYGDSALN
ncbi:hypothetical protein [Caulobacter sp. LARHSG274]